MQISKSCLREINLAFIFALFIAGCASLKSPRLVSITGDDNLSYGEALSQQRQRNVFNSFCSGQRQIRSMKLAFTFVSPKNTAGIPLDVAAHYQSEIENRRKCLFREALYKLSEIPCDTVTIPHSCGPELRHGFSFVSVGDSAKEIIRDAKDIELPNEIGINFRVDPVFVLDEGGKKIVGFFGQSASDGEKYDELSKRYVGHIHRDALFFELAALMAGYTMLEPRQYQEDSYGSRDTPSCEPKKLGRPIAINKDGSANISEAVDERESIWRRYIIRHSKIKESKAVDAQLTNAEVSLDLNDFCRYGRHIEDLTSQ